MKYTVGILAIFIPFNVFAGFCTMQLQEEANVFEVNCLLNLTQCSVTGYFTHPKLSPGYKGLVASLSKAKKTVGRHQKMLVITTYRNGTPKVKTPVGYWVAIQTAEKILIGEHRPDLKYYDATSGRQVARPKMKCVDTDNDIKGVRPL